MSYIDPRAYVEPGAEIEEDVVVEAFAVVKKTVKLKKGVVIKSHAYIDGNTTIGENTIIWPSASIGTKTQDLKFQGEQTYVVIGKNCEVREFATINSSCQEGSVVSIGDGCLIMAYCHIAHNCTLGKKVIMSNGAMLAGHVTIEDYAIIGGMTPIHQYCRIGAFAMVGGFSRISKDIPPYTLGTGAPYKLGGLNLVGLKRHKFSLPVRQSLSKIFRLIYRSGLHLEEALVKIKEEVTPSKEVEHFINFCQTSKRGLICLEGVTKKPASPDFDELLEEELV